MLQQLHEDILTDPDTNSWQQYGACRTVTTLTLADFFFEGRFKPGSENEKAHISRLRAVCASCPVNEECDNWATRNHEAGYWAGLTEDDRRKRKSRLKRERWRASDKQRERRRAQREMLELSFLSSDD